MRPDLSVVPRWIAVAIVIGAVGACGPFCGNGKLNLSNGTVNRASFTCPVDVTDYGYAVDGTVDADNQTGKSITVKSMSDSVTVVKLAGNWSLKVGETSGATGLVFSPKTISAGSKTTIKFTMPWTCTDVGSNTVDTYADFKVTLMIETSSGTYHVALPNHRMKMA